MKILKIAAPKSLMQYVSKQWPVVELASTLKGAELAAMVVSAESEDEMRLAAAVQAKSMLDIPEKDLIEIEQTTDSLISQVVKALDEHDYDYRDYFINKGLMTLNMLSDFILSKEMNEVRFRQFVKSVNVADEDYQWHFVDKRTGQIKDLARTSTGSLISTRLYTIKEIVEEILNVIK